MDKIYLLHASAQAGKNTCAEAMKEYYEATYHKRILVIAFADYLKFILDKYYDQPHARTPEYRTRIQQFGTEQAEEQGQRMIWANLIRDVLEVMSPDFDIAIIPDWRFRKEWHSLFMKYGAEDSEVKLIPVYIDRPNNNETDGMTEEQRQHESERNLDNFQKFDYTIINENAQLQKTIQQLIDMIDKEETQND